MTMTEFLLARIAEDEAEVASARTGAARWLRRRVLAECGVKRQLVEVCGDYEEPDLLGILATVYADHPEYREEWRP